MKVNINAIASFQKVQIIFIILQPYGDVFLVGGCIRDLLMNAPVKDIDIATSVLPEHVALKLRENGIKFLTTGIEFGTVTAVIEGECFEITTFRKDIENYGRKAKVEFTSNLMSDAARRDFTMNALYSDVEGNLTDFFGGIDDIKNRVVRFIGDPNERIKEDFLRILRYFRFLSYLGCDSIDRPSLLAASELHSGLSNISGERIKSEMFKMLSNRFVMQSLTLMEKCGLLSQIQMPSFNSLPTLMVPGEPLVNLVLILKLLCCGIEIIHSLAQRWCLSKKDKQTIIFLTQYDYPIKLSVHDDKVHMREHYKIVSYFDKAVLIKAAQSGSVEMLNAANLIIEKSKNYCYQAFPITGYDLLAIGIKGQQIKVAKEKLLLKWIESDFSLDRQSLLNDL